jgi:GDP-D-mannose dehydratase
LGCCQYELASKVIFSNYQAVISIDPRYFSLTEVETLLGDFTKPEQMLG